MARIDAAPGAPRGHTTGQGWPAWRYGPDGQSGVFQGPHEVPEGWHDGSGGNGAPVAQPVTAASEALAKAQAVCDERSAALEQRAQELDDREAALMERERELMERARQLTDVQRQMTDEAMEKPLNTGKVEKAVILSSEPAKAKPAPKVLGKQPFGKVPDAE